MKYKRTTINLSIREFIIKFILGDINFKMISQRKYQWSIDEAELLIKSIDENVPIPSITIIKHDNLWTIIDGKQRLTTIICYLLKWEQIESIIFPNGKKLSENERKDMINIKEMVRNFENKYIAPKDEETSKDDKYTREAFGNRNIEKKNEFLSYTIPINLLIIKSQKDFEKNSAEIFNRLNKSSKLLSGSQLYKSNLYTNSLESKINIKDIKEVTDIFNDKMLDFYNSLNSTKDQHDKDKVFEWVFSSYIVYKKKKLKSEKLLAIKKDVEELLEELKNPSEFSEFIKFIKFIITINLSSVENKKIPQWNNFIIPHLYGLKISGFNLFSEELIKDISNLAKDKYKEVWEKGMQRDQYIEKTLEAMNGVWENS